ncbi:B12-binding domain-containing radical SAM protein [Planctomycetota bacterium]
MLTLINTNTMQPPIAPIGLEYVASAVRQAGIEIEILDLGLQTSPEHLLREYFTNHTPALVGLTFRNVDDCFWPSCQWFAPELARWVQTIKSLTDAPVLVGGIGFSIFAERLVEYTSADFGIRGDGEEATVALYQQLSQDQHFSDVPGLVWRNKEAIVCNPPAWPESLTFTSQRDLLDNVTYFRKGGQIGFETKRGCNRGCVYCADPVAKGPSVRLRDPSAVADEVEALLAQGIDVLHTCDAEFNVPGAHALAICREFIHRQLGDRLQWYAYLSVVPFDRELARAMKQAGCVGIDFTTDAACPTMLKAYGQPYGKDDIAKAVELCREQGLAVMMDMLTCGPGETPETLAETIAFMKQVGPDGIGTGIGIRVYPGTGMVPLLETQGPWETNPSIRRKYDGPVDLFQPTFYISHHLGPNPAKRIKDLIDGDPRFFEPMEDTDAAGGHADSKDHNYNDNAELVDAIARGERGAYWHIMLKLRGLTIDN